MAVGPRYRSRKSVITEDQSERARALLLRLQMAGVRTDEHYPVLTAVALRPEQSRHFDTVDDAETYIIEREAAIPARIARRLEWLGRKQSK
jgi:hypothetical protein